MATRALKLCFCGVFLSMCISFGVILYDYLLAQQKTCVMQICPWRSHGYGHELARVLWIAIISPDINRDLSEKQNIGLLHEHVCGRRDSESREMSRRMNKNEEGR